MKRWVNLQGLLVEKRYKCNTLLNIMPALSYPEERKFYKVLLNEFPDYDPKLAIELIKETIRRYEMQIYSELRVYVQFNPTFDRNEEHTENLIIQTKQDIHTVKYLRKYVEVLQAEIDDLETDDESN